VPTDPGRELLILGIRRRGPLSAYSLNAAVRGHAPLYRPLKHGNITIGAEYRKALGTVVIGGLTSSLFLTLFVVPMVYVWYRRSVRTEAAPRDAWIIGFERLSTAAES